MQNARETTLQTAVLLAIATVFGCEAGQPTLPAEGGGGAGGTPSTSTFGEGGCQGESCDATPGGWDGPATLLIGDESCPGETTLVVQGGVGSLDAPDAVCGLCTCGSVMPTCNFATIDFYPEANCMGSPIALSMPAPGVCSLNPGGGVSARAHPLVNTAQCPAAGGGVEQLPAAEFEETRTLCLGASDDSPVCVFKSGDVPCPPGPFVERSVLFGVEDDRGCSACSCGELSNYSCGAISTFHGEDDCAGGSGAIAHNDVCAVIDFGFYGASYSIDPLPGFCAATGGEPTGAAAPADPMTVCCKP